MAHRRVTLPKRMFHTPDTSAPTTNVPGDGLLIAPGFSSPKNVHDTGRSLARIRDTDHSLKDWSPWKSSVWHSAAQLLDFRMASSPSIAAGAARRLLPGRSFFQMKTEATSGKRTNLNIDAAFECSLFCTANQTQPKVSFSEGYRGDSPEFGSALWKRVLYSLMYEEGSGTEGTSAWTLSSHIGQTSP